MIIFPQTFNFITRIIRLAMYKVSVALYDQSAILMIYIMHGAL